MAGVTIISPIPIDSQLYFPNRSRHLACKDPVDRKRISANIEDLNLKRNISGLALVKLVKKDKLAIKNMVG